MGVPTPDSTLYGNGVGALQQAVRHFCLVRDARKVVLRTQWTKWEAAHHRRITKDIQYRGTAVASEPKGSVIRDCDFTLVGDTVKTTVCRMCVPLTAAAPRESSCFLCLTEQGCMR